MTPEPRAGFAERLAESGFVPTALLRTGIRRLLAERLATESAGDPASRRVRTERLLATLGESPIAVETAAANRQHYELPPEFFGLVLGPRRKYSGCLFPRGDESLAEAEERMLEATLERAAIEDGMTILDLGCGWGSFSLFLGERFPRCRVVGVSNSRPQGDFIRRAATARGLANVAIETADVNRFAPGRRFDRIVSIEMFEHLRNPERMLDRAAAWLEPGGKLFLHVFCHREHTYLFETDGRSDWMARHFFTGGMMPADDLLPRLAKRFAVEARWRVDGRHYARTAALWRENLEMHRTEVTSLFREVYGARAKRRWFARWRLFFLACEELFGYRGGDEWAVAHYRFTAR